MVTTRFAMRFETDAAKEDIADLHLVMRLLGRRHGPQFRALERRIERVCEDSFHPVFHPMGSGLYVVGLGPEVSGILKEARSMGLLA